MAINTPSRQIAANQIGEWSVKVSNPNDIDDVHLQIGIEKAVIAAFVILFFCLLVSFFS